MQTLQPEAVAGTQQPYVVTQQSISVTQASALQYVTAVVCAQP